MCMAVWIGSSGRIVDETIMNMHKAVSSKEQIPSGFKHVHLDGPSRLRQMHQRKTDEHTNDHKWTHMQTS